jgi:hypothetical protein
LKIMLNSLICPYICKTYGNIYIFYKHIMT